MVDSSSTRRGKRYRAQAAVEHRSKPAKAGAGSPSKASAKRVRTSARDVGGGAADVQTANATATPSASAATSAAISPAPSNAASDPAAPAPPRPGAAAERLDVVFHALADGSRRRIVHLLRESGELRVSDLAAAFSMSLNGVSKHVKVLEQAGLVTRRVRWREHWLSLEPHSLQLAYEWVHFYHQFWAQRLGALTDMFSKEPDHRNQP